MGDTYQLEDERLTLTIANLSSQSLGQVRRHLIVFLVIVLLSISIFPLLAGSSYNGSSGFHAAMEILGAALGLIAGIALIVKSYAFVSHFHLCVGLGFFVSSLEDAIHGFLDFTENHLAIGGSLSSIAQHVPTTHLVGRMLMGLLLISALFVPKWFGKGENPKRETIFISLAVILIALVINVFLFQFSWPKVVSQERFVPRPMDFLIAIILTGILVVYLRKYYRDREMLTYWIALSIEFHCVGQLMMSFSSEMYDAFFDWAHVYKVFGYAIPLLGFSLYQISVLLERKQTEAERRKSKLVLERMNHELSDAKTQTELILQSIGEGVIVVDLDSRTRMINAVAQELLDIDNKFVLEQPILELFANCSMNDDGAHKIEKDASFRGFPIQVKSTIPRTLDITCTSFTNERSEPAGRVFILRDITREKEIDRMKTQFVSSVSHELRTPLTSIKGFTSTILRDPEMPNETRNRFLKIIEEESDRLALLINDLLEISRIESGTVKLSFSSISIKEIVLKTVNTLEPTAIKKNIELKCNIPDELPNFHGDAEKIQSVIVNLVANAIKFSPSDDSVSIEVSETEECLRVSIIDNGPGIPKKDCEHIFERFYRVVLPGNEAAGTGLGLAIAKDFIERHGGRIEVSSQQGEGSTFTVFLPLGPGASEAGARVCMT
ncbi:MAG: PAS domain-containing protein [Proteobacteria bacterium]|nr:PAS domain-containing protein [Pseudomonadota bacterium]